MPALRAASLAALALLGACGDGAFLPTPPAAPAPPPAGEPLAALSCEADVRGGTLSCAPPRPATGARAAINIGGQGVNVRLASSGMAYDSVAQVFRMNVSVQNLLVQRMGTRNGPDTTGVRVFFHTAPTAAEGSGTIAVLNADGEDLFTASGQPFYEYRTVLPTDAVSPAREWRFAVPRAVTRFVFQVYVHADILPVLVFDQVVATNRDIYRVAIDGGDYVRLTTHAGDDQNPTAARRSVVVTSFRDGNAELYSVPFTGGTASRLTTNTSSETEPALSRDGTRLAYASDAQSVAKNWTANADGTGAARATPTSFGFSGSPEAGPAWNAAGNRLAFVSALNGASDIYELAPPDGTPATLVSGTRSEVEPTYSPDGTRVAFTSNRDGDVELYVMTLATGTVTRLTNRVGSDTQPTWLSDGRIAYMSNVSGVLQLRWLDPGVPGVTHTIPLPPGTATRPFGLLF